jgi:hypothetical protein
MGDWARAADEGKEPEMRPDVTVTSRSATSASTGGGATAVGDGIEEDRLSSLLFFVLRRRMMRKMRRQFTREKNGSTKSKKLTRCFGSDFVGRKAISYSMG